MMTLTGWCSGGDKLKKIAKSIVDMIACFIIYIGSAMEVIKIAKPTIV